MAETKLSAKDQAEIEQARKNLEARAFTLELDRPVPEGHEIAVIEKLRAEGNRYIYKVVFFDPRKCWY